MLCTSSLASFITSLYLIKPSTVAWGLITNGGNGNAAIRDAVTADDDDSWTVTIDIPAAVQSGKLNDPTTGVLQFACVNYDDAVVASAKVDLVVDSTDVKGKADIVSSDTDGDGAHKLFSLYRLIHHSVSFPFCFGHIFFSLDRKSVV